MLPLVLLALPGIGSGLLSEVIIIALIALVLFIVMKLGRSILKVVFGIIINSVLGIMLLLILDFVLELGIPLSLGIVVPIAIFGLPATGTIVLLKVLGVATFA